MNTRAFLLATLIAGVVMGLLGGLPILSIANCVLCMWVWLSAILAIWLYRRFAGTQPVVTPAQGALLGLVSGVIGAIVVRLLSLITGDAASQALTQVVTQAGVNLPAQMLGAGFTLIGFLIDLVLYSAFGALGGWIGATIFKPKAS